MLNSLIFIFLIIFSIISSILSCWGNNEPVKPPDDLTSAYLKGLYRWQVTILYDKSRIIGSGTIIDANLIITSSSILANYTTDMLTIRGGYVYQLLNNDHSVYEIKLIVRNPSHGIDGSTFESDFSLIYINRNIEINHKNIDLPIINSDAMYKNVNNLLNGYYKSQKDEEKLLNKEAYMPELDLHILGCKYSYSYIFIKTMSCSVNYYRYKLDSCFTHFNNLPLIKHTSTLDFLYGTAALDLVCENNRFVYYTHYINENYIKNLRLKFID